MRQDAKNNLTIFLKVGIPYTIGGALIIFLGICLLKHLFTDSEYLTTIIFVWLALFWIIYQPLFRNKIKATKKTLG